MGSKQLISAHKENAEIYHGSCLCKQKSIELLSLMNLPKALLPLTDLVELGYNPITGFVWLKQKQPYHHRFRGIGRTVSYDAEVTTFIEDGRMRRLTGVKSKELLIWVSISDIYVDENQDHAGTITFASSTGLARTFPVSTFEVDE